MRDTPSYPRRNRPAYPVGSVDNALQLIQILRDTGGLRLIDAAAELGISHSAAHRLLAMLVYRGFAVQGLDRAYRPGPAMTNAPIQGTGLLELKRLVQPHLELLMLQTGETTELLVRVGRSVRFLCTVQGTNVLSVEDRRGWIRSAAQTSGGKALLAELSESDFAALFDAEADQDELAGIVRDRDREQVIEELARIRRRGFATNTKEGAFGVAVTLRAAERVAGAITVSVPLARASEETRFALVKQLVATKRDIEVDLAASGVFGA